MPPEPRSALLRREAAAIVLISVLFWLDFIVGRRALFYDTLLRIFLPNAEFLRASLARGELPFWNPHLFSGVPFAGNPQAGVFYPPNYLYAIFRFPRALALDMALHVALAALAMRLLADELGLSPAAGRLAAAAFALNGFFIGHYAYPSNIHSTAWAPLVLLHLDRAARGRGIREALLAAAFFALQIFGGHPQFAFYTLAAAALVWIARRGSVRSGLAFLGATGALTAAQWIPTVAFAAQSWRGSGLGYGWATSYSEPTGDLLRMLVCPLWNRYFTPTGGDPHIVGLYFGLPILILALAALGSRARPHEGLGAWRTIAAGLAAAGLLLSVGRFLPGYALLYRLVPPLRWFRFPAQALFLACLGMPLLAAAGLEGLAAWRGPKAAACVALLAVLDLAAFARGSLVAFEPSIYETTTPTIAFLQANAGSQRVYMTPRTRRELRGAGRNELEAWLGMKDSLVPNVAMAYGLRDADGFDPLTFGRYEKALGALAANPLSPWMDVLAVRYVLSSGRLPETKFRLALDGRLKVYENPGALPRAYFVDNAVTVPKGTATDYVTGHPGEDYRRMVVLESGDDNAPLTPTLSPNGGEGVPGKKKESVRLVHDGANRVVIDCQNDRPGWVVLADTNDAGWKVYVNDKRAPALKADGVQRAVAVGPGMNRIEWKYRPASLVAAVFLSLIAWIALGLLLGRRPLL